MYTTPCNTLKIHWFSFKLYVAQDILLHTPQNARTTFATKARTISTAMNMLEEGRLKPMIEICIKSIKFVTN